MFNYNRGFTLIELMIVIVVLAILAAVALPRFSAVVDKGKISSTESRMKTIKSACSMFAADVGAFPDDIEDLMMKPEPDDVTKDCYIDSNGNRQPYTQKMVTKWRGPYLDESMDEVIHDAFDRYWYCDEENNNTTNKLGKFPVLTRENPSDDGSYGVYIYSTGPDLRLDSSVEDGRNPDDIFFFLRLDGVVQKE